MAVFSALRERMSRAGRPSFQLVVVLPKKPHGAIEKAAIGPSQAKMIFPLGRIAEKRGRHTGVFTAGYRGKSSSSLASYIHATMLPVESVMGKSFSSGILGLQEFDLPSVEQGGVRSALVGCMKAGNVPDPETGCIRARIERPLPWHSLMPER